MKTILITGATSGIGYELTKIYAKKYYDLVLVATNSKKLKSMKKELEKEYNIKASIFDVDLTKQDAPEKIYKYTKDNNIKIDILVNNAGVKTHGEFTQIDKDEELSMLDLNVRALTHMMKLYLKDMKEINEGKILNIASSAAYKPGPLMAAYYASNAYVLHLSKAVSKELENTNVHITSLCLATKANEKKEKMSAEDIAKYAYKALEKNKKMAVPGIKNKLVVNDSNFM